MNNQTHASITPEGDFEEEDDKFLSLDIRAVLKTARAGWLIIVVAIAVSVLATVIYANLASPTYTSAAIARQKAPDPANTAGSPLARLGGSLAGGLLGQQNSPPYQSFYQILTAPAIAERLMRDHPDFIHEIFSDNWDADKHEWVMQKNPVAWAKAAFYFLFEGRAWSPPNSGDVLKFLDDKVNVSQDATSGMITISYTDENAAFAMQLVQTLVTEADNIVRKQDTVENAQRIRYLEQELQTNKTDSERQAIIDLLSSELYQNMILRSDQYYSIDLIVPPNKPLIPVWPKGGVLAPLSLLFGMVFGCLAVWLLNRMNFNFQKVQPNTYFGRRRERVEDGDVLASTASARHRF